MVKKIISTVFLFCIVFKYSTAQNIKIKGQVFDDQQKTIAGATVKIIILSDSTEFVSTSTNATGNFELTSPKDTPFSMIINFFGYESLYKDFRGVEKGAILTLSNLILKPVALDLEEITVTRNKQLFKKSADKLVVNIGNTILGGAGNATEILERLPGVFVDRQNNNIKVNGKDGVSIMINGKLKKMPQDAFLKMLESINGSNIDKIELINSNAGEDAEGNGGLINIVMNKTPLEGIRGSYNVNLGMGKYEKSALGGEFSYSSSKVDVFGNASFGWNRAFADFGNDREIIENGEITKGASNYAVRKSLNLLGNIDLSLDYKVFKNTKLGVGLSSSLNRVNVNETGRTKFFDINEGERFSNIYHEEVNRWSQFGTNLNLSHSFREDEDLTFNFDYLNYNNRNPHNYKFENFDNTTHIPIDISESKVSKSTPIDFYIWRTDYKKKVNDRNSLSFGVKHTSSILSNSIDVMAQDLQNGWKIDPELSQNVKMREEISAGYGDYKYSSQNGLEINLGLRYEYTQSTLKNDQGSKILDRNFGNFFPTISLAKTFKNNTLSISYNRRITRPTFSYLAPYVHFVDEMTFITGNMELNSSISDNIEGSYQYKGKYTATIGYSHSDKPIIPYQIQIDRELNKQIIRAENLKNSNLISLGFSIPYRFNSWWESYTNLIGFYSRNEAFYNNNIISNKKAYFSVNMNHSFKILKDLTGEISGMYQSKSPFVMAYLLPFGKVSTGVKLNLKNEGGIIRVTVDDLFWNMNYSMDNPQPNLGFNQSFRGVFSEPRVVRVTYTKNLGGGIKKKLRSDSAEEEKARAGN